MDYVILLQNDFTTLEKYIDHVHNVNGANRIQIMNFVLFLHIIMYNFIRKKF